MSPHAILKYAKGSLASSVPSIDETLVGATLRGMPPSHAMPRKAFLLTL